MTDFLTADTNLPSYMMFPRFLLDMEINETAKMLYIILLDRARLSQKNEGWSDIDGHVFIYFTIEALAEVLHKSQMTVKTALAVLEKQELIFRKRQGPGQPNRIYVKLPKETIHYTDRFLSLITGRIILNAYPVIWLLPESNIRTMQLPSSVGQDRIILLPGKEITKVRNTKHYDKIYRKSNRYNTKQRASA